MRNFLGWLLTAVIAFSLIGIISLGGYACINKGSHEVTERGTVVYLEDIQGNGIVYQDAPDVDEEVSIRSDISSSHPQIHEGRWVTAQVTAYCPCSICCGDQADGITSTGVNVLSGNPNDAYGIAADPRAIPYGTRIYVPGYWESLQNNETFIPTRLSTVDDTGGAMRQSWDRKRVIHLDVRYRTHRAALSWGVRIMRVFIYD